MMNRLDAALFAACPTIMVPRYGAFEALMDHGHRFLSAADGIHLELRRPWLYTILPVATSAIPLPYGFAAPCVQFRLNGLRALIARFIDEARLASPLEHAAWLSMDIETGLLRYEPTDILSQGRGHIRYQRPSLPASRCLAVDLHSHGRTSAFFSAADDADSVDDCKLEIVCGNLDTNTPSIVCRLSLLGINLDYSAWLTSIMYSEFLPKGVT